MAASERRRITPDNHLLAEVFPNTKSISTRILSQNFGTCTFTARQDDEEDFVVRIQPDDGCISPISVKQELAAQIIPEYVPTVYQTGTATTEDGKKHDYSVTTYFKDTVTLESVWCDLTDGQQLHVVEQIVPVFEKLHNIDLSKKVQQLLKLDDNDITKSPSSPIGGPWLGFYTNMSDLLHALVKFSGRVELINVTDTDDGGLTFECEFDDIPSVSMSKKDLLASQAAAVFCHNDVRPQDILVRQDNTTGYYKIISIIDWELAGFFLVEFESVHIDSVLQDPGLCISWYELFKNQTARFIQKPLPKAHDALVKALNMVLKGNARWFNGECWELGMF